MVVFLFWVRTTEVGGGAGEYYQRPLSRSATEPRRAYMCVLKLTSSLINQWCTVRTVRT